MNIQKAIAPTLAVTGLVVAAMGAAQANLSPTLVSVTGGGPYTYTYSANLSGFETVAPGDFLTINNFGGYLSSAAPAGFTASPASGAGLGTTTVTFTYGGGGQAFQGQTLNFLLDSSVNQNVKSSYADQYQNTQTGVQNDTGNVNVPAPGVPAVPEPGTMVPFALGGLSLLGLLLRARKPGRSLAS